LVYGKACAANIDPIEKKPFFDFLPGTSSYSIATVGCQFECKNCQNWQISQGPKLSGEIWGEDLPPEIVVRKAKAYHCHSISYTYTDPIVFSEYALETMKIAKKEGIKNIWVTSGFWSGKLFDSIYPYVDAANIDLKYFSDEEYKEYSGGRLKPVLDTLKKLKKGGIWLEITTLVIPTVSDSEVILGSIADFIKSELGTETPWHVNGFSGAISWQLKDLPDTPVEVLIKARDIGVNQGLNYVYIGNVPGIDGESTFCPSCKAKMIKRTGYVIRRYDENGKCSNCGQDLNLIFR
jgi:pyruvate formate lyase activating enzyme